MTAVLAMASADVGALRERATAIATRLGQIVRVVDTEAEMGGGSLAGRTVPSVGLAITPGADDSADELVARLRRQTPAIVARVAAGDAECVAIVGKTLLLYRPNPALEAKQRALGDMDDARSA